MTRKKKQSGPWSGEAGLFPYRVVVEENLHRGGILILRWWVPSTEAKTPGKWKRKSLNNIKLGKSIRREDGSIDSEIAQWALEQAMVKSQELSGSIVAESPAEPKRRVTIGETEALITDEKTGKYPHDSEFRRDLVRSLKIGVAVWGANTFWDTIDDTEWTKLIRERVSALVRAGHIGLRSTEITVTRIYTAVRWLRKRKHIPAGAAELPEEWRDDLKKFRRGLTHTKRDPEPFRPRHTPEDEKEIWKAAPLVDPRMFILLYVGSELRLGQVARCMRTDLKLDREEYGILDVHGAGHKGGETVELSRGMREAVDRYLTGFLRELEEKYLADGTDYPLFPAGRIAGKKTGEPQFGKKMRKSQHVSRERIIKTFHDVERAAKVEPVKGRAAYGLRRLPVDQALHENMSESGMKALGGWSSTAVPKGVYAEKENRLGRREARDFKAKRRGEGGLSTSQQGEAK